MNARLAPRPAVVTPRDLARERPFRADRANPGSGFECVSCHKHRMDVTDSRATAEGYMRRRRRCQSCGYRLTTVELPVSARLPANVAGLKHSLEVSMRETIKRYQRLSKAMKDAASA